jgi:hypothetical protein
MEMAAQDETRKTSGGLFRFGRHLSASHQAIGWLLDQCNDSNRLVLGAEKTRKFAK